MTLFFPRTQEIEGFPVHAELFVADESLQSGVSVTCQAADSGLSANSRSKPERADVVTPSMPQDTENQLGASLPWSLQGNTLVQKVWIVLDREQLHSPLSLQNPPMTQTRLVSHSYGPQYFFHSSLFMHSSFHLTWSCIPGCIQPSSLALG